MIIYRLVDGRAWRKDTLFAFSTQQGSPEKYPKDVPNHLSTFHAASVGFALSEVENQTATSMGTDIHDSYGEESDPSQETAA